MKGKQKVNKMKQKTKNIISFSDAIILNFIISSNSSFAIFVKPFEVCGDAIMFFP